MDVLAESARLVQLKLLLASTCLDLGAVDAPIEAGSLDPAEVAGMQQGRRVSR